MLHVQWTLGGEVGGGGHSRIGWTLVKENIETRAKCVKAIAVFKPEFNKV